MGVQVPSPAPNVYEMASKSWKKECIIKIHYSTEGSYFLMKNTFEEKLQMCKEHVIEKKSLSYICEPHNYCNVDELAKISIRRGNQISELEKQNKVSTQKSEYWEDRFFGFVDFIRIKLRNKYERKNYMSMVYELHNQDVIDKDVFSNLYKVYEQSEKTAKKDDDFEI